MQRIWLVLVAAILLLSPRLLLASGVSTHTANCAEGKSRYVLYAPGKGVSPAILLLHGAGDTPENFIEVWKDFAQAHHIVLIVPVAVIHVRGAPGRRQPVLSVICVSGCAVGRHVAQEVQVMHPAMHPHSSQIRA